MSPFHSNIVLLSVCLMPSACLSAQSSNTSPEKIYSQAVQAYRSLIGYSSRLYNGSEYIRTYPNVSGHPFLAQDSLQYGSISYEGVLYNDVLLNYDIARGEVITKGAQAFLLSLVPEKIDSFNISSRRFLRYNGGGELQLKGFYEVLHSGKVWVLASRVKRITAASRTDEQAQFATSANYFLLKAEKLSKVSDRSDLLNALSDQKEAVRKYMQQNGLNIRSQPEQALVNVALFYDQTPD